MFRWVALFLLLLGCGQAHAQGGVLWYGAGTPGHVASVLASGAITDGGTATNGLLSAVGVTAPGQGICQNSGPITEAFSEICLGFTGITPTIFASGDTSLILNINGTTFTLPGSGSCLGCGTMAGQNAVSVAITGGTIAGANVTGANVTANATTATLGTWLTGLNGQNTAITGINGAIHTAVAFPSSTCNPANGFALAFACDLSNLDYVAGIKLTGTATLGQPTANYTIIPNLAATFTFLDNFSGWNQSTTSNSGRTGAVGNAIYASSESTALGDTIANYVSCFTAGAKAGAHGSLGFLANPACTMFGGSNLAGNAGVFLQGIGDINLDDNGYDVAGVPFVTNMHRTVATGALGVTWLGYRAQSTGTSSVDALFSGTGPAAIGLDLTGMTNGTIGIALPQGVGIFGNVSTGGNPFPTPGTTVPGGSEIVDNGAGWQFSYGAVDAVSISATLLTSNVPVQFISSASTALVVTNKINVGGVNVGLSAGVSCSGSPTSSFASINGIVTHC